MEDAATWLANHTALKRVILGYSNGGSELTYVCQMGFLVDLAFSLGSNRMAEHGPVGQECPQGDLFS